MNINLLLEQDPYHYDTTKKQNIFLPAMAEAFNFHYDNNYIFKKWLDQINYKNSENLITNFPFFPSSVF